MRLSTPIRCRVASAGRSSSMVAVELAPPDFMGWGAGEGLVHVAPFPLQTLVDAVEPVGDPARVELGDHDLEVSDVVRRHRGHMNSTMVRCTVPWDAA